MPSKFFLVRWLEDESVTVLPIQVGTLKAGVEAAFVGNVTDIKFGKKYYEGEILRISGNRATLSKLCNDLVYGRKTREEILEATEHASSVKAQDPTQECIADNTTITSSSTAKSSTNCKLPKASTKNMKRRKQLAQAHAAKERVKTILQATKVPGRGIVTAKEKTVGLAVTAESRLDEDYEDMYSLSSTDEDLNPEEIEPILIRKEKSLNKACLAARTDSVKDDSYMKHTKPPTKLKLSKHESLYEKEYKGLISGNPPVLKGDHYQGTSYCYTSPGHTPPSSHTPPGGVGKKVELVDGYGVFISKRQLDEAMAASGNSPLKLIRNFMSTFFDAGILANSSCYGTRQHKGLNRDVTAACIKYVQSMHPGVSRSALVDAINDKCANARRKRKARS